MAASSYRRLEPIALQDADKPRGRNESGERRVDEFVYTRRRVDSSAGRILMTFAVRSQS
jgi:hypothetical protein